MKTLTFESLQRIMKQFYNSPRNFAAVFLVDENKRIVYTDGFFVMIVSVRHHFEPGVYDVKTGASSQVQYPNYKGIGIEGFAKKYSADKLLHVANLIKPNSKKLVVISKEGQIDPEHGEGFNLKYLNIAAGLGMEEFQVNNAGLGKAFKEGLTTEVYLVETKRK